MDRARAIRHWAGSALLRNVDPVSRILLATDGSPGAEEALRLLIALRPRPEDVIHVVCVAERTLVPRAGREPPDVHAAEIADRAVAHLRYAGCAAIVEPTSGSAPRAILDTAVRVNADVIVLGSRGRGRWASTLLGSTAHGVVHGSTIPTLVVRGHPAEPQWILLAASELRGIRTGAHALGRLPWPADAAIDVLTPNRSGAAPEMPRLADAFDEARRALPGMDVRAHVAEHSSFPNEIHRYARQLASDLIVLSLDIDGEDLADEVLGGALCPVLVVPVPTERARRTEPVAELAIATGPA